MARVRGKEGRAMIIRTYVIGGQTVSASEFAPYAADALQVMQSERDEARAQVVACQTEADDLRAKLRALHSPWVEDERWCGCCAPPYYELNDCPTIKVLDMTEDAP